MTEEYKAANALTTLKNTPMDIPTNYNQQPASSTSTSDNPDEEDAKTSSQGNFSSNDDSSSLATGYDGDESGSNVPGKEWSPSMGNQSDASTVSSGNRTRQSSACCKRFKINEDSRKQDDENGSGFESSLDESSMSDSRTSSSKATSYNSNEAQRTVNINHSKVQPYPYFHYQDHSREKDSDPLVPIAKPSCVPSFPAKLHAILIRNDLASIVCWMSHGRSFCIKEIRDFELRVLTGYFQHNKFQSFIRLLKLWGFQRLSNEGAHNCYFNEYFLRGLPHLIKKMPTPSASKKVITGREVEPDLSAISLDFPVPKRVHSDDVHLATLVAINAIVREDGPKARLPICLTSLPSAVNYVHDTKLDGSITKRPRSNSSGSSTPSKHPKCSASDPSSAISISTSSENTSSRRASDNCNSYAQSRATSTERICHSSETSQSQEQSRWQTNTAENPLTSFKKPTGSRCEASYHVSNQVTCNNSNTKMLPQQPGLANPFLQRDGGSYNMLRTILDTQLGQVDINHLQNQDNDLQDNQVLALAGTDANIVNEAIRDQQQILSQIRSPEFLSSLIQAKSIKYRRNQVQSQAGHFHHQTLNTQNVQNQRDLQNQSSNGDNERNI